MNVDQALSSRNAMAKRILEKRYQYYAKTLLHSISTILPSGLIATILPLRTP